MHGVPHAARLGALPAAVELVLVRLPDALHELWEQCGDARFEVAKVEDRRGDVVQTDRGA